MKKVSTLKEFCICLCVPWPIIRNVAYLKIPIKLQIKVSYTGPKSSSEVPRYKIFKLLMQWTDVKNNNKINNTMNADYAYMILRDRKTFPLDSKTLSLIF